jgi:hypothetical protein
LAEKAITDPLTRCLVIFGACAGLCYNALWYFPVLIVIGGFATLVWDTFLQQRVGKLRAKWDRRRRDSNSDTERVVESSEAETTPLPQAHTRDGAEGLQRRTPVTGSRSSLPVEAADSGPSRTAVAETRSNSDNNGNAAPVADTASHAIPIKIGVSIIAAFFSEAFLFH